MRCPYRIAVLFILCLATELYAAVKVQPVAKHRLRDASKYNIIPVNKNPAAETPQISQTSIQNTDTNVSNDKPITALDSKQNRPHTSPEDPPAPLTPITSAQAGEVSPSLPPSSPSAPAPPSISPINPPALPPTVGSDPVLAPVAAAAASGDAAASAAGGDGGDGGEPTTVAPPAKEGGEGGEGEGDDKPAVDGPAADSDEKKDSVGTETDPAGAKEHDNNKPAWSHAERWSFTWWFDIIMKTIVFAITGSTVARFTGPILKGVLGLQGSFCGGPWSFRITYLLIMMPIYTVTLVIVGTVLGQGVFFRAFAVRMWSHMLPKAVRFWE